jgi:hypothetical protein
MYYESTKTKPQLWTKSTMRRSQVKPHTSFLTSEYVHRGTEEYYNITGKVDIINSTLGKAMGGASGGYTTGPKELIDLLRQRGRPYLFSNSLPPPVVAAGITVSITVNSF